MISKEEYESRAIAYCEEHGIVVYRVKGNLLVYNVSYPKYLGRPHYTVQHTVNLDTGVCLATKALKRYDKNGVYNRG